MDSKFIISMVGVPISGKTTISILLKEEIGGKLERFVFEHKFDDARTIPIAANRYEKEISGTRFILGSIPDCVPREASLHLMSKAKKGIFVFSLESNLREIQLDFWDYCKDLFKPKDWLFIFNKIDLGIHFNIDVAVFGEKFKSCKFIKISSIDNSYRKTVKDFFINYVFKL